jgi:hypothetical protein
LSKRQYKNFVILHKEIFEKKNNKVGKNKFYNKQKRVIKSRNESFVASPEIEGRNAVEADNWARHKKTFYSE